MNVSLSIIIVNCNTKELLDACLSSILAHGTGFDLEIFVVDNASTDGSTQMVKQKYLTVHLMENSENVGFARANNQAIEKARGDYLFLLNSDAVILPGTIDAMVKFMDAYPMVGALGAKLLSQDLVPQISCRHFPTVFTILSQFFGLSAMFPRSRLWGRYDMGYWDHRQARKVDCVPGTALFVRKSTIQQVGPLDGNYFLYFEDTDWCYRINQAGWEVFFLPQAEVIHRGGASAAKSHEGMFYDKTLSRESFSSLFYYFRKFHGSLPVLLLKVFIPISLIMRMLRWTFPLLFHRIDAKEYAYKMRSFWRMIRYCAAS
jgi:GT2 family glycosyltransferase